MRVDVTRLSDKAGDAFEVKLPLLPDRAIEKRALFTTLEPGKTTGPDFPEKPRPGTGSQTIVFTNQPGLLELASGRTVRVLDPGTGVGASPGLAAGRAYVLSNGGLLVALDLR